MVLQHNPTEFTCNVITYRNIFADWSQPKLRRTTELPAVAAASQSANQCFAWPALTETKLLPCSSRLRLERAWASLSGSIFLQEHPQNWQPQAQVQHSRPWAVLARAMQFFRDSEFAVDCGMSLVAGSCPTTWPRNSEPTRAR